LVVLFPHAIIVSVGIEAYDEIGLDAQ